VQLKFLGVEWRPQAWNGIDGGGGPSGKAGENENMDPDGQASRGSFLWFDPASGEAPFTYPIPLKWRAVGAPSSLCLELGVDWF
jgi:hypothetical protein